MVQANTEHSIDDKLAQLESNLKFTLLEKEIFFKYYCRFVERMESMFGDMWKWKPAAGISMFTVPECVDTKDKGVFYVLCKPQHYQSRNASTRQKQHGFEQQQHQRSVGFF